MINKIKVEKEISTREHELLKRLKSTRRELYYMITSNIQQFNESVKDFLRFLILLQAVDRDKLQLRLG
ncbi:MAG: hypothetical protein PF690_04170 [Deltaproteobacteria bacterium]|nr:hypothetical protein [Deltaproteobacteria bacterium]